MSNKTNQQSSLGWFLLETFLFIVFFFALIGGLRYVIFQAAIKDMEKLVTYAINTQHEWETKKRTESFTIEGKVVATRHEQKEVDSTDPEVKKKTVSEDGRSVRFEPGKKTISVWIVDFEDGRTKEFWGTPCKPITTGVYLVIRYNGMNEITDVTEKK